MIEFEEVKAQSIGRWPGILTSFGIDVGDGTHKPCPVCGGTDRFRFTNEEGKGEWFCNNGHPKKAGDGFALVMAVTGMDFKATCEAVASVVGVVEPTSYQKEKTASPELLRKMYAESTPVKKGDMIYNYLVGRGLNSMPAMLRCSMKCWEPETKRDQIAMLASFQLPDGEFVTMQRTYIDAEGNKLDIKSPKKVFPPLKKMTGGAVRLYEYKSGILGLAEGIETAISMHEAYKWPVWATLSSVLMSGFVPPPDVSDIVIFADNDKNYTGQKAAYTLANRLATNGGEIKSVNVEVPEVAGEDFLDERNRLRGGD